jgi:hypothetical protein
MSVAVCVTVVVPIGKTDPLAKLPALRVTDCTAQLSVAVGVAYVTTAPDGQLGSTVMFAGQLITGGVLSTTVTVWVALAVLPCASVAEYVTVV